MRCQGRGIGVLTMLSDTVLIKNKFPCCIIVAATPMFDGLRDPVHPVCCESVRRGLEAPANSQAASTEIFVHQVSGSNPRRSHLYPLMQKSSPQDICPPFAPVRTLRLKCVPDDAWTQHSNGARRGVGILYGWLWRGGPPRGVYKGLALCAKTGLLFAKTGLLFATNLWARRVIVVIRI